MWLELEAAILAAAEGKIRNFERHRKRVYDENVRRVRRSADSPPLLVANKPTLWETEPALDPYHVRKRSKSIAHAITKDLRAGTYAPLPPAGFRREKLSGGSRTISNFALADEVISNRLYRSLLKKNRARLSARSYAYRDDANAYDALAYMQAEWRFEHRVFVAEYDFTDFFDSISHQHLWTTIDVLGLTMTSLERHIVSTFLTAPLPFTDAAEKAAGQQVRGRGVPLGTSVSLLLANIAVSPLDRALERLGVGFVRYADDTVIWSRDYAAICRAVDELHEVSSQIGSPINQGKSMGVRLLVGPETSRAEIASTKSVTYLSHDIGLRSIRLKSSVELAIKQRLTELIYDNLLREPVKGTQALSRIGHINDRDYVVLIWQLRRYLYGHLAEIAVRRMGRGQVPLMQLTGAIARYPLIDDDRQLAGLDSWLATQIWLAVRKREALLKAAIGAPSVLPTPWGRTREELIDLRSTSERTGQRLDLRLPSTLRMATVVREAVKTHGRDVVGQGLGLYAQH